MIERHLTSAHLNIIVNHPDVLPYVSGSMEGPLDLAPVVQDRRNVVLMGEYGGILFHQRQAGLYEAHTVCVPEGRGKWALAMAKEALRWMFVRTDCLEVITRVPSGNVAALALTRACRLTPIITLKDGWQTKSGRVDCSVHGLTIQSWMTSDRTLEDRGAWFLNSWRSSPIRDAHAMGLAYEMLLHGQGVKSAIFLKRWSAIAGVDVEIECFPLNPPRLKIGGDIVVVRGDKKFILF